MPTLSDLPRGWGILALTPREDYFALWNQIRDEAPLRDAGEGLFLVSGWALVNRVLRDPALLAGSGVSRSFGGPESPVESVVSNWLMSQNGETHRRARALVARLFTPAAAEQLAALIRDRSAALVAGFVDEARLRPADFASLVAQRLPSEVIRHLFAIEPAEWEQHVQPLFTTDGLQAGDGFAAVKGLAGYFHAKITAARGQSTGGIIDQLGAPDRQGGCLTEAEVIANAVLIVTAAIDTTAGLITNTLLRLLEHPAAMVRVQADTALLPRAIEESLRHCPSAPSSTRHAPQALELGGVHIPAGSDLFLSLAAANRDPAQFPEPDRFDIDRDCGTRLLTFGGGAHFCLGASLARTEARLLFEALFAAGRDFRLCETPRWRQDNPSVRSPAGLLVSCQRNGPHGEERA
jgi:cytochrome P450